VPNDLAALSGWFTEAGWPDLTCPTCAVGHLEIGAVNTVRSAESVRMENEYPEDFEPEWYVGHFSGVLTCTLGKCHERLIVVGDWKTDELPGQIGGYANFLHLRYVYPRLPIVKCPAGTPDSVRAATEYASEIIWADPSGAANRLRTAIEELLTERKVKRFTINRQGRRERLKTHQRIELYKKARGTAGDILMAVKWIGNQGSHEQGLTVVDVMHGADLLTFALQEIYDRTRIDLAAKATRINKYRGIRR
jgi:Domain of unknown function (DUF4145)